MQVDPAEEIAPSTYLGREEGQSEYPVDQPRDRGGVHLPVIHATRLGERGHHHHWHADPLRHSSHYRRGCVVVPSTGIVVGQQEHRAVPLWALHQGVDEGLDEELPQRRIQGGSLRVDRAGDVGDGRELPVDQVVVVLARVDDSSGSVRVAGDGRHGQQGNSGLLGSTLRLHRPRVGLDVVRPPEVRLVELVEYRRDHDSAHRWGVRRETAVLAGHRRQPVGERSCAGCSEEVVVEREPVGQAPVVGKILAPQVADRGRSDGEVGLSQDEPVHLSAVDGSLGCAQCVAQPSPRLVRIQMVRLDAAGRADSQRKAHSGGDVVDSGTSAEVVVEGVTALHHDDHVLDHRRRRRRRICRRTRLGCGCDSRHAYRGHRRRNQASEDPNPHGRT